MVLILNSWLIIFNSGEQIVSSNAFLLRDLFVHSKEFLSQLVTAHTLNYLKKKNNSITISSRIITTVSIPFDKNRDLE